MGETCERQLFRGQQATEWAETTCMKQQSEAHEAHARIRQADTRNSEDDSAASSIDEIQTIRRSAADAPGHLSAESVADEAGGLALRQQQETCERQLFRGQQATEWAETTC